MYEPIRFCPVADPFGTNILIISPLSEGAGYEKIIKLGENLIIIQNTSIKGLILRSRSQHG
jgi:hypothetical protein